MQKNISAVLCYAVATLFLGYEMGLQVSPAVMVNELIQDIGLNASSLSLISAAYFCAYAGMQIPAGIMFDKFNAKTLLTIASAICTLGIFVFVVTKSAILLAAGRFITGFGSAFAFIGVLIMAKEWFDKKYFSILVGIAQLIAALGAMFGEVPLSISIEENGWQSAIIGLTIIGVVLTALIAVIIKNNPKHKSVLSTNDKLSLVASLKLIIKSKQSWAIALYAFACWGPVTSFAELWGVEFLRQHLVITKTEAAAIVSSVWIGIAIGAPIIGIIAAKKKKFISILRVTSLIGFIATFWLIFGPVKSIYLAHILAIGFGIAAASQILTFSMITENIPDNLAGTAIGFMNMAVVAGGAILQPLIGMIIHYSWDGIMRNNAPWYTSNDYQQALIIIPICFFICYITSLYALKESKASN
ncbi:MAG: MFS transporter [Legionellales bacterium]|jgi:MFS family permease|nr:MFS transporter [Legionellales bacterium]